MLQVFINGPPGVGKTTLCKLLCAELGLASVSTGDLLKENISQRTELGCIAKQCIASKALVPDHVVVDMVAEKVLECNLRDQGWVLDGFPRTVDQCSALRCKMISPTVVIILELPERECTKRITGRRFDGVTGNIYHLPNAARSSGARETDQARRRHFRQAPATFEAYRTYGDKTNALFSGVSHRIDEYNYNYDCDGDIAPAAKKQLQEPHSVSPHANQKRGVSESSASSSAVSSASSNNNEELPPSSLPVAVAAVNPVAPASPLASGVDMAKFKDMLLDGFEVLKHGRRGSPHARLIFTDMDFKRIFWQKVTKETNGGRTKKAKLDRSLVLADVVQVVRGMKTEVLKRAGDVSKYERYLSLVADDRTLDMELSSDAACGFLLRGSDVLLHGGGGSR